MKKRILSIILAATMVVSLFPVIAFADAAVAKIGTTEYATLEDAIAAVDNDETIVMIADCSYDTPLIINNGKTFTIDYMDGSTQHSFRWFDMMGSQSDKDCITVENGSNVTVKNMKYLIGLGESDNRVFKVKDGTLTLDNFTSLMSDNIHDYIICNDGGTVNINNGHIETYADKMFIQNGGVLNIGGSSLVCINSVDADNIFYIGDANTDDTFDAGTININDGDFQLGQILYVNAKANININKIKSNNGVAHIFITEYGKKSNIKISNYTADCNDDAYINIFNTAMDEKISITGGKYKYAQGLFCIDGNTVAPLLDVSLKGGIFGPSSGVSTDAYNELSGLLAAGYALEEIPNTDSEYSDGYFYRVICSDPVCKIGTTNYATLEEAIDAVQNGETITLLDDITYSDGPDFVIDGKAFTIDFYDGTTEHALTVNTGYGIPTNANIFSIINSGDLTINKGSIVCSGMYGNGMLKPFNVSGSALTLNSVKQTSGLAYFLTIDGGTVTIDGGTFGTGSSGSFGIILSDNSSLIITNNPTFNFQSTLFKMGADANTDPDAYAGSITIESGTFNGNSTSDVIALNAKADVTISGGTYTSANIYSSVINTKTYGYKSNVTISDFTSDSKRVFNSYDNANINQFTATVSNGHYKYNKGAFAADRINGKKADAQLSGGYFGPDVADADALAELNAICASGYHAEELANTHAEYANGYRYTIVAGAPTPGPTPPAPTPAPSGGDDDYVPPTPKPATYANCKHDGSCPIDEFPDLDTEAWYHDGVHYCLDNGIMQGYKDGEFKPGSTINRAQIAVMLWRLEGSPKTEITTNFYGDMEADDWYAEAASWAYSKGIFNGVEPHVFAGTQPISRQQLAAVLYRYAQYKGEGFTGSWMFLLDYKDRASISSYADEAVHWCSMNGVVQGKTSGNFDPKGDASRAAAAAMIQRFSEALSK